MPPLSDAAAGGLFGGACSPLASWQRVWLPGCGRRSIVNEVADFDDLHGDMVLRHHHSIAAFLPKVGCLIWIAAQAATTKSPTNP